MLDESRTSESTLPLIWDLPQSLRHPQTPPIILANSFTINAMLSSIHQQNQTTPVTQLRAEWQAPMLLHQTPKERHAHVLLQGLLAASALDVLLCAYLGLPGMRNTMSTVWHPSARNFSSSKLTPSSIRLLHTYTGRTILTALQLSMSLH